METIDNIVDSVGDTFKGFFSGGSLSTMSTGAKVVLGVVALLVVLALLYVGYKLMTKSMIGGRRMVGPSGCCGKMQPRLLQKVEATLSQQDMDESDRLYDLAGMPRVASMYDALPYDNYQTAQGFTSPTAKPESNYETPLVDRPNGTLPMVRQQVPTLPYQRPALGEADFINMAYSA